MTENAAAAAVSIKMPPFTPNKPSVFFVLAEAQFHIRQITADETKYFHVISALPPDVIKRIEDLVKSPPNTDKYEALKGRLTDSFDTPPEERATRLLNIRDLGGCRPSTFADHMLLLTDGADAEFFLCAILIRSLPDEVRQVVQHSTASFRDLAKEADKHFTASGTPINGRQVNAALTSQPSTNASEAVDAVNATNRYNARAPRQGDRPKRRNEQMRFNNRAPRQGGGDVEQTLNGCLCFFHDKFGHSAKKCEPPCLMSENASAGARK